MAVTYQASSSAETVMQKHFGLQSTIVFRPGVKYYRENSIIYSACYQDMEPIGNGEEVK
jgi:hypothetical protein